MYMNGYVDTGMYVDATKEKSAPVIWIFLFVDVYVCVGVCVDVYGYVC